MLTRSILATLIVAVAAHAQVIPVVVAYADATAATHQSQFTSLSGSGYRPISLCVTGGRANARYSAVWIRRSGAGFTSVHGVDRAGYDSWRTQQRNAGLRPLLVSTSGSGSDKVYAGVYVADGVTAVEELELSLGQIGSKHEWAYGQDYFASCMSVGGSSTTPLYSGIWEANSEDYCWCWAVSTASAYPADFNARATAYGRVISAQTMPNGSIGQLWRDDTIGAWETLPGLTTSQLLSEISTRRPSGAYPISIQSTGTGAAARHHVVFAFRDRPLARAFTTTGTAVPALVGFDQYMEDLLRTNGIRSGALAIAKDGRLVLARGYTFAESGYAVTQPTSLFRIASSTKVLTGLSTNLLIQRSGGSLTQSTLVRPFLGLGNPYDARFGQIRVLQCLEHTSGVYSDNVSHAIAAYFNSTTLPVNQWQTVLAMNGTSMFATPGAGYQYANAGYYLLGAVIEQASNKSYEDFLREDLAAPFGVTRIWVAGNERSQLRSTEVEYRNPRLDITQSEIHTDRRMVPIQFGGGGDENLLRRQAAGGVITSPVDYVRIFSGVFDLACDGVGPFTQGTVDTMLGASSLAGAANPCGFDSRGVRANGVLSFGKNGGLWGSRSQVIYRDDGVSIAVFLGRGGPNNADREALNSLADAVTTWPAHDFFPNYGLPAFTRTCPRIHSVTNTSVANVSDEVVTIDGDVFSGVDSVEFGSTSITSRSSTSGIDGWYQIVSDDRIELHPPQGLVPVNYTVRLRNGQVFSAPFTVTVTRATGRILNGPATTFGAFELIASRGASSSQSLALMTFSPVARPSVAQGIVSLGIGDRFTQLGTWPVTVPFNLLTGSARWQVPALGIGTLHFQVAVFDPNSINQFPLPVTNVESVVSR